MSKPQDLRMPSVTAVRMIILCFVLVPLFSQSGLAQVTDSGKYPSRPVNFILPYSAGGTIDIVSRLLVNGAATNLGQPIVVLNKPGGGGATGVGAIAAAKPDGYTFGFTSGAGTLFVIPYLENLPYHPIKDIRYLLQFGEVYYGATVRADSPFKTFEDVIAYARANPEKLTFATGATFSVPGIVMELIARKEKVRFTHVPFKSSPEIQTALIGGHIQLSVGDFNYSLIEAGKIRLLMLLADKRSEFYPQTPVTKELGYPVFAPAISTIGAPKDLPDEIARKLEQSLSKAMEDPAFIKAMKDLRFTIFRRNSQELSDFVAQMYESTGRSLKEMGFVK